MDTETATLAHMLAARARRLFREAAELRKLAATLEARLNLDTPGGDTNGNTEAGESAAYGRARAQLTR